MDGLQLGDAIRLFLDAKRAGGRSERTLLEYRKKLDLFRRRAAGRLEGEGTVDAPVSWAGPDEVEGYVVHMRGLSDSSIKNHLSVLRSFFDTLARRLDLPDPTRRLDEVRFHQKAPKRTFLTRREADVLLGAMERRSSDEGGGGTDGDVRATRRGLTKPALAARDHAAFSAMIYAGLRIEETTALTVEDLSFARGSEEIRVAKGKGNPRRLIELAELMGHANLSQVRKYALSDAERARAGVSRL